jgi:hypothetical protein
MTATKPRRKAVRRNVHRDEGFVLIVAVLACSCTEPEGSATAVVHR